MKNLKVVNLNIFLISAVVICFEILSTRISSVIYVQNYSFIIISLAILGLGSGGVFSYYRVKSNKENSGLLNRYYIIYLILAATSLVLYIFLVVVLQIIIPYVYFFLLFLPFFFIGIVYSLLFSSYAKNSYQLYASDLAGASIGSIIPLIVFNLFSAPNAVLFLGLILFISALAFAVQLTTIKRISFLLPLLMMALLLVNFGKTEFLGRVPIGNYPEKDFYYVYEGLDTESKIIESRWSINGRADLVEYNFQGFIKQLFVDGAAGSQMFRFNGNIANHDILINKLLLEFTTSVPFLFLKENEKNNMLVIGPGGGKEVLTGLLGGVKKITGVEINRDFVDIVKQYKKYNGGIYTDFPNVNIVVDDGRHYVKRSREKWDILLMALPSTEQLQSIDNLASNENYLLTVEAIKDYLKILSTNGSLIFTVHNRWELIRLIVTTLYAFEEIGISNSEALNHFLVLGADNGPTIVIRKNSYTTEDINYIRNAISHFPAEIPKVTFLPYNWQNLDNTIENILFKNIHEDNSILSKLIAQNTSDISPVRDDSPYFYKINRGIPSEYLFLILFVFSLTLIATLYPYFKVNVNRKMQERQIIVVPLIGFSLIGLAFMILEISLFQKLILVLGSPTVSLSILLSSMLIGMGIGSYFGSIISKDDVVKRMTIVLILIVLVGTLVFVATPSLLNELLHYSKLVRSFICFIFILPLAFLLGILFPSLIQVLNKNNLDGFVPWMYGINGITSVLGSIIAVVLSMVLGNKSTMLIGISIYFLLSLVLSKYNFNNKKKITSEIKLV